MSEKTNQSTKIILKYHLVIMNSVKWSKILLTIQKCFNNFVYSIERIFNESVYDFTLTNSTNFTKNLVSKTNFILETNLSTHVICQKIINVIIFSQFIFKYHYDQKHKLIQFLKNNYALLRLYWNYSIFFTKKLKVFFLAIREIVQNSEKNKILDLSTWYFSALMHSFCFHHCSIWINSQFWFKFVWLSTISAVVDTCKKEYWYHQKLYVKKNN